MLDQGLEPEIAEMTAYFPGVSHGIPITTEQTSSAADVAVVKGRVAGLGIRHIALADDRHSAIGGSPVVLLAILPAWMLDSGPDRRSDSPGHRSFIEG